MRRAMLWLLVGVMLLGVTGFAGAEDIPTITIGKELDESGLTIPEGHTGQDNYFTQYVEETCGVKLEYAWYVPDDTQQIALAIASGSIPDVMIVDEASFNVLRNADMIQPLTEAFEQSAGTYLRSSREVYPESFGAATFGGELMAIPDTAVKKQHNITWIRQDWLDALDLPLPTSMDELIETAKAFMASDFDGNGIEDTVGISMTSEIERISPIFNNMFGAYPGIWYVQDDALEYGSVTPEARAALEFTAGLYKDGLIDPEFATVDTNEAIVAGRCGIAFGNWSYAGALRQSFAFDGADWVPFLCPMSEDGSYRTTLPIPSAEYVVVSKECANPEMVIAIIEAEYDFHRYIDLDDTWTERKLSYDSTGVIWKMMPIAIQLESEDIVAVRGEAMVQMVDNDDRTGVSLANQAFYDAYLLFLEDNTQLAGWQRYKGMYLGCNVSNDERNEYVSPVFWGMTDTMEDVWTTLSAMEEEVYLKIIMGESDITAFDAFVEQWYAMGGTAIVEEVNAFIATK